ncbi:MAG: hypothetical protein J4432_02465 [DPANN group archaeon]|nr:hypothetical protein [DPANN group archaeon]
MGNGQVTEKEIDGLVHVWEEYVDRQQLGEGAKPFILNPNVPVVHQLAKGVLDNEKNHGLKYCPCRVKTGDMEEDIKLLCPCNFQVQKTWRERGECWCNLFWKSDHQRK